MNTRLISLICALWCAVACSWAQGWCDYEIPLAADYVLMRFGGEGCFITSNRSTTVVDPDIQLIGNTRGGVFYGISGKEMSDRSWTDWYFVLDVASNQVQRFDEKDAWIATLRERGIDATNGLVRPTRFYRLVAMQDVPDVPAQSTNRGGRAMANGQRFSAFTNLSTQKVLEGSSPR